MLFTANQRQLSRDIRVSCKKWSTIALEINKNGNNLIRNNTIDILKQKAKNQKRAKEQFKVE